MAERATFMSYSKPWISSGAIQYLRAKYTRGRVVQACDRPPSGVAFALLCPPSSTPSHEYAPACLGSVLFDGARTLTMTVAGFWCCLMWGHVWICDALLHSSSVPILARPPPLLLLHPLISSSSPIFPSPLGSPTDGVPTTERRLCASAVSWAQ